MICNRLRLSCVWVLSCVGCATPRHPLQLLVILPNYYLQLLHHTSIFGFLAVFTISSEPFGEGALSYTAVVFNYAYSYNSSCMYHMLLPKTFFRHFLSSVFVLRTCSSRGMTQVSVCSLAPAALISRALQEPGALHGRRSPPCVRCCLACFGRIYVYLRLDDPQTKRPWHLCGKNWYHAYP